MSGYPTPHNEICLVHADVPMQTKRWFLRLEQDV